MKYIGYLWLVMALMIVKVVGASEVTLDPELPRYSQVYDDQADPFKDAKAAIALAKASNRNVLIEIGGNWCAWCHKMDAFLAKNPDVAALLHQHYVLLKVNVSDSNENKAFMESLPPVLGYPHMYVATANGKMMLSKDTAELLDNSEYSVTAWTDFLQQWQVKNNAHHLALLSATKVSE
ncbi:thioredoxin family protein [Thalassotalea sp. G2M2-11]|uniref:thioredoxin family protein n=1 Tax=Thalassotalea sp. G2M2-11 TaxID=2787627 RepID=UPI0019D12603|nr:thioredoxin family protein [Thalassotalea sp. G2M2-11]